MGIVRDLATGHHLDRRVEQLSLLLLVAAALQVGAAVGLASIAGWSDIRDTLARFHWPYLLPVAVGVLVSFVGYYFAYEGVYKVRGGPKLPASLMRAVVIAGFGGFLAQGGAALDRYALEAAGTDERDAKVRVTSLGGLEHGVLSLIGTVAGIAVIVMGLSTPPLDFSLPWAVLPVPGFALAFALADRCKKRFDGHRGWRGALAVFFDAIILVRTMFLHPVRYAPTLLGMTLFWLAESFTGWAALAAFGYHMNAAQFYIGFATGMLFTRRTAPLAGAGVLDVVLPVAVWSCGAPFAPAIVGIILYRLAAVWLPMPFALSRVRKLRGMGERRKAGTEGMATKPAEPALRPS